MRFYYDSKTVDTGWGNGGGVGGGKWGRGQAVSAVNSSDCFSSVLVMGVALPTSTRASLGLPGAGLLQDLLERVGWV